MSFHVQEAPPEHYQWLISRAKCVATPHFRAIEALDGKGEIKGMVGYDGWLGNAAQMHVAFESAIAARALLTPAFDYLFNFAGKEIALGLLPSHSTAALRFDLHIGFREVHRIKDGWAPGDDMVLLEMRKDECRWLRNSLRKVA